MMATTGRTTTSEPSSTMTDQRRSRFGFRARVLGFSAALLAGAIVVGLVVQRAVLLRRLDAEVAASLEQEREEMQRLADGRNPATGQPFEGDVRAIFDTFLSRNVPIEGEVYLTFVDGRPYATTPAPVRLDRVPALVERWATLTEGSGGEIDTDAGPVRYLAVPLRTQDRTAGVFVVANFLRAEREEVEAGIKVAAGVAGVVLVVATGLAWVIAGRLLRPVRQLTDSARSISETDLSRRIPVEGNDEIAELTRTFNDMLDRLAGAFAAQRAFVDDAGHELRTPITIIRGHLELMGDDPHDRAETVALVTDELDRMARIVEDLLLLAKAEQPDFVRPQLIELSDLTTELVVKARALGERDWRLDACAEGTVWADAQRLAQAMFNLARNAVEHTAAGAEIGLGSTLDGDEVRMWVRDTGAGVDPGERERIFDRFARGRSGSRRSDGAGLGLAIVRAVAEGHHGRVELHSPAGQGATFTLVFPAHERDRAGDLDRPPPAGAGPPPTGAPAAGPDDDTREIDVVETTRQWPAS